MDWGPRPAQARPRARPGTGIGSSRRRRRDTRFCTAGEQPAVLEEDVDELPEHVIERLDELLADIAVVGRAARIPTPRPAARRRPSGSRARARSRAPGGLAASSSPAPNAIAMSSPPRSARPGRARSPPSPASPIAGSARLPTITGWTNSTATCRASERAAADVPERDQPAAAGEALGHQVAETREPLGLLGEELAVGLGASCKRRLQARAQRAVGGGRRSRGHLLARARDVGQPVAPCRRCPRRFGR